MSGDDARDCTWRTNIRRAFFSRYRTRLVVVGVYVDVLSSREALLLAFYCVDVAREVLLLVFVAPTVVWRLYILYF